jgi:hypothetical protein
MVGTKQMIMNPRVHTLDMDYRLTTVLLLCAVLVFAAGCTMSGEEVQIPETTPAVVYPESGMNEQGKIMAKGYGTKEFPKVLFDRGPATFHATFDGPGFFAVEIDLHGANAAKPFTNVRGPLDETVTVDIGTKEYYYVTISGQGNWTVVQS